MKSKNNVFKDYAYLIEKETATITEKFALSASHVSSIYIGGGTPSVMPVQFFEKLLKVIGNNFRIAKNAEITVEINPESGDSDKLSGLKSLGFNRLSIGAQSFNDDILKTAGRIHNKKDIFAAMDNAKKAGFDNISLDLIIGLPKQTEIIFYDDIKQILNIEPKHISVYMLSIEKETKFYKNYNKTSFISEEQTAEYYEKTCELLDKNNYIHYEISNFSKKGYESRHNLNYWQRGEYLGLGPSASSFFRTEDKKEVRKTNVSDLGIYACNISNKDANKTEVDFIEVLTEKDKINEEIFLSLRTGNGIKLKRLLEFVKPDIIENIIKAGFMQISDNQPDNNISLTVKGMLLSSEIFARLML